MTKYVEPGKAIGVFGGGQLGRMFAIAARQMGYRVHVFSPGRDTPAGQVADREVDAAYDDLDAVADFAKSVDAISYEFENIHLETVLAAQQHTLVRPAGEVLHTTQNRLREKTFLQSIGLPTTPFLAIRSAEELCEAVTQRGRGVVKTASWGYDGKGQAVVEVPADVDEAWRGLGTDEAIFEEFVDFSAELSVVAARTCDGQFCHYGPILNQHRNHILDVSSVPAGLPADLAREAADIARTVLERLAVVGVLCVEFFLTTDGRLLINELAPRPHNSGHLTIEAYETSQFEQQVRAVCGLPLGSSRLLRPAAMANLLGDVWQRMSPDWSAALREPGVSLHLYGKQDPRPGRKMGHLTALADSSENAVRLALTARDRLASHSSKNVGSMI